MIHIFWKKKFCSVENIHYDSWHSKSNIMEVSKCKCQRYLHFYVLYLLLLWGMSGYQSRKSGVVKKDSLPPDVQHPLVLGVVAEMSCEMQKGCLIYILDLTTQTHTFRLSLDQDLRLSIWGFFTACILHVWKVNVLLRLCKCPVLIEPLLFIYTYISTHCCGETLKRGT